jgi:hypothetical protein
VTSPGHNEKPIFEAEKAPPTVWEQIVSALRPRRSSTPAYPKPPRPQGTRNVLIAMGTSLVGAIGGVLFMLGVLGVSMSVMLAVALVATRIQNLSMGINWIVAPASLAIFAVFGGAGYLLLRSVGIFRRQRRTPR